MSRIHELLLGLALLLGLMISSTEACGSYGEELLSIFTKGDSKKQVATIQSLRESGPQGLAQLQRVREELLGGEHAPQILAAVNDAMDHVAQQRYGHVSGLYWYTDLEEAKKQAAATNRPILSLRMLGKLTEEYSCANSRFFRVLLYADPNINSYLRDHFVLHWQSVRDVPQVTVTLEGGGRFTRTVTGNSAHFVIAPDGQVLHIIPGLWHPQAFLDELQASRDLAKRVERNPSRLLSRWHAQRLMTDQLDFEARLTRLQLREDDVLSRVKERHKDLDGPMKGETDRKIELIPAEQAMPRAMSKATIEAPLVQPIRLVNVRMMWQRLDDSSWKVFADSFQKDVKLSTVSRELIEQENQQPASTFEPLLIESLASDTAFNRYVLGRQIHQWFGSGMTRTLDDPAITRTLYHEILGMDLNDPWAGLHDPAVYTGLVRGGMQPSTRMSLREPTVE